MYNAFMVSDFMDGFETESSEETIANEIDSITAIKFEIEYGQENNCFFDSTQESFETFVSVPCVCNTIIVKYVAYLSMQ